MQNEENKYIANIKVIKDLADADFDIIKGIVETTSNTQDLTKLECEAFDSYLVINLDVTDKKSNDYLSLKDKSGVYVFKMIEDWTVPSDFNPAIYLIFGIIFFTLSEYSLLNRIQKNNRNGVNPIVLSWHRT